jgi:two-component system sensor histidine kinase QseC
LRYSPRGATVRVSVVPVMPDWVMLVVEDSGPGLPPEHLARLGERFFRALGNERPGSGLGWSIVRRIALALQLSVEVDRSPELGGLRVQVGMALSGAEADPADSPQGPSGPVRAASLSQT